MVRVVQHVHIAGLHAARVARDHGLDALAHRAQVHRHVRRVGDQVAFGVEQRAAEVQPLLDVDRVRGVLQLQPHLLGDVHEQVVEHLQQHRVDGCARCKLNSARRNPLQHQMVKSRQAGAPAGLHHGRRVLLGDDGRAVDHVARTQVFAHDQRRVVPRRLAVIAGGVHAHGVALRHRALRVHVVRALRRRIARHHRFDRHRLHDQRLALHQERKALPVRCLERLRDLVHHGLVRHVTALQVRKRHDQRRIGAVVAHVHAAVHANVATADFLLFQLVLRRQREFAQRVAQRGDVLGHQLQLDRRLAHHVLVGQAHAVGRQHAGQRVHQHARHA